MGKSKKQVIGYKYFMGIHMGLGRALESIIEIRVGGKVAWQGEQVGNGSIRIQKPDLFGGEKAEGGIDGQLDVMLGGPTQRISDSTGEYAAPEMQYQTIYDQYGHTTQKPVASQIASGGLRAMLEKLSLPITQYRGMATLFFDGLVCSMNPYPKTWQILGRRHTAGWDGAVWYPEKVAIWRTGYSSDGTSRQVKAMNPAHILYECCTNRIWARGLDRAALDDSAFRYAADLLHGEGLGLCLRWARQDNLETFVQTVLDHINGLLFVDKQSGLLTLKLIRGDYNPDTLPVYTTDSGIIEITEADNAALPNLVNEVIVKYRNVVDNEDGQVRVHNLASIQAQGNLNSKTVDYSGCPDSGLALLLAQRDLRIASTNIRRFTMTMDRRAWHLQPGDVVKISDPATRGIGSVIVRIGTVEESDITNGAIKVVAVQDTFGFPLSSFTGIQPPAFQQPNNAPELARRRVYEASYAELAGLMAPAEFAIVQAAHGYINAHGERPHGLCMGFELAVKAEGEFAYDQRGSGDFSPLAELSATLDYLTDVLSFRNPESLQDYTPGNVALIDDEFIQIVYIDMSNNTMGIKRGVRDTVPARHYAGALIWLTDTGGGTDWKTYVGGEHVDMKLLPWTMAGTYPEDQAPVDSIDFNFRWFRPYAPGLVGTNTIDGGDKHWFSLQNIKTDIGATGDQDDTLTITWTHRDRVLQADRTIDHMQGSIGPEPGTTYVIEVVNELGQVVRTIDGISGTQYAYHYADVATDLSVEAGESNPVNATLRLYAKRDGYRSWQHYTIPISVYKRPPQNVQSALNVELVAQESPMAGEEAGIAAGLLASLVAQDSEESDLGGANIAAVATPIAQRATLLPLIDFRLLETPYITLARSGKPLQASQAMAFIARPSDRIIDSVALLDRAANESDWSNNGPAEWTPWAVLGEKVSYLTDTLTFSSTSAVDGTDFSGVTAGSLLLVDNEIMAVDSITATRVTVRRGVADTVPAPHNAKVPIWFFSGHGEASRIYAPDAIVQGSLLPLDFAGQVSPGQMPTRSLTMLDRVSRPYPPGLVLADGKHWYEGASALADSFNVYAPKGRDVVFTWEHRNKETQGTQDVDHFAVGIAPPDGLQYRIWIGYNRDGVKTTLYTVYTSGNTWVLTADLAATLGETAGRRLDAGGYVVLSMAINAVAGDVFNWQGYNLAVKMPSFALTPGRKPGGDTDPGTGGGTGGGSTPNPDPNPGTGGTPGTGDNPNVDPTPTTPTDPDVPGTDPEVPVIPPTDEAIPGWGNAFDHGWASEV